MVAVRSDAPLAPAPSGGPVWLHYGSSISQGSNTAGPSTTCAGDARRVLGGCRTWHSIGFFPERHARPVRSRAPCATPWPASSASRSASTLVNADLFRLRSLRAGRPRVPRHAARRSARIRRSLVISRTVLPDAIVADARACRFRPHGARRGTRLAYVATGDPADAADRRQPVRPTDARWASASNVAAAGHRPRSPRTSHITSIDGLDLLRPRRRGSNSPCLTRSTLTLYSLAQSGGHFAARTARTDDLDGCLLAACLRGPARQSGPRPRGLAVLTEPTTRDGCAEG